MGDGLSALIGLLLLVANAFFVAAEYALVATRRSQIETLAKQGNRAAKALTTAFDQLPRYIAGCQVGVSVCSLALGATFDNLVSKYISQYLGAQVPIPMRFVIAMLIGTYVTAVLGELVPKYVTLSQAQRTALAIIIPLRAVVAIFMPLTWLVERSGAFVVRLFGINPETVTNDTVGREELLLLIREGGSGGVLDAAHANVVTKALKFDKLDAEDIMVHRLDIRWIDIQASKDEVLSQLIRIPHSRVPVCRGDIDDVAGVVYVRDILRLSLEPEWDLAKVIRPVEMVPQNLTLTRVIERMRESRTQILIVADEYGGTSGLITLEDVVEEVFGELEDQLESERPPIERTGRLTLSARADVRFDELLEFLEQDGGADGSTQTLATLLTDNLDRIPKLGDTVQIDSIGKLTVENMARRRITRVRITLHEAPADQS